MAAKKEGEHGAHRLGAKTNGLFLCLPLLPTPLPRVKRCKHHPLFFCFEPLLCTGEEEAILGGDKDDGRYNLVGAVSFENTSPLEMTLQPFLAFLN